MTAYDDVAIYSVYKEVHAVMLKSLRVRVNILETPIEME